MNNRNMPPVKQPEVSGKEAIVEQPVQMVSVKSGPINVVAIRNGFFGGYRRPKGSTFTIPGPDKLGSWMKKI